MKPAGFLKRINEIWSERLANLEKIRIFTPRLGRGFEAGKMTVENEFFLQRKEQANLDRKRVNNVSSRNSQYSSEQRVRETFSLVQVIHV